MAIDQDHVDDEAPVNPSWTPTFGPDRAPVAPRIPGDKATYASPGSRWPDYRPDMPPRPSIVAIYREDGGKIGG